MTGGGRLAMRTRLIIAFIVVVVLAAIPEAWLKSQVRHR